MDRRGFLGAMLAACAAPAVVRAGSLMRINPAIVVPTMEIGRVDGFRIILSDGELSLSEALDQMAARRIERARISWSSACIEGHGWVKISDY